MALSCLPQSVVVILYESFLISVLSCSDSFAVFIIVLLDLTYWILSIRELLTDRNGRRVCLLERVLSLSCPAAKYSEERVVLLSWGILDACICSSLLLLV